MLTSNDPADDSRAISHDVPGVIPRGQRPAQPAVDVAPSKWRAFGGAVLDFHRRVAVSSMCRCGRTWRECDVWRQAEQYGIRQLPR